MVKTKTPDIAQLVELYSGDLLKRAFYKISDPEIAKDIVQDTFLAATEKIHTFKGDSSPRTWLYSILNFKIIDHYRAKSKHPVKMKTQSVLDFFTDGGEWRENRKPDNWHVEEGSLLDNSEFQSVLASCLDALPDKWNACMKMKYLMSKKGDDICQELDITPTNLWQIMHRAKLNLRDCLETNWFKN